MSEHNRLLQEALLQYQLESQRQFQLLDEAYKTSTHNDLHLSQSETQDLRQKLGTLQQHFAAHLAAVKFEFSQLRSSTFREQEACSRQVVQTVAAVADVMSRQEAQVARLREKQEESRARLMEAEMELRVGKFQQDEREKWLAEVEQELETVQAQVAETQREAKQRESDLVA